MNTSKPIHILLIDDNYADNFYHKIIVEEHIASVKISMANDGKEALDLLLQLQAKNEPFPNIIFLDINMPIMNGWEFLDALKVNFSSKTPSDIYMLSTSKNPADMEKASSYEIVKNYYTKPLEVATLKLILNY